MKHSWFASPRYRLQAAQEVAKTKVAAGAHQHSTAWQFTVVSPRGIAPVACDPLTDAALTDPARVLPPSPAAGPGTLRAVAYMQTPEMQVRTVWGH